MKKFIISCTIMFLTTNFVYADDYNFDALINDQSLTNPKSLPVWYPPGSGPPAEPPSNPGSSGGGGHSGSSAALYLVAPAVGVPLILGSGFIFYKVKHKKSTPEAINNGDNNTGDDFSGGEVVYNIDFKNSKQTPIYKDTMMYIKIPEWLKYSEGTFKFNNVILTEKQDKDRLTFFSKERILEISLKNLNADEMVYINFRAKVVNKIDSENNSYCSIKFYSVSKNSIIDWQPFPYK